MKITNCLVLAAVGLPLSTKAITVSDGLVVYYELNGNANDSSGNSLHGSIVGTLDSTADRFGNADGAYHFSAGINRIFTPELPVNLTSGGANTVSFWMKWDGSYYSSTDTGAFPFFWGGWDGATDAAEGALFLQSSQSWFPDGVNTRLGLNGTAGHGETWGVSDLSDITSWIHVAAIFRNGNDLTQGELYINGQKVDSDLFAAPGASLPIPSMAGATPAIGGPDLLTDRYQFIGAIDDFAIFDRALSSDEIRSIYSVPENASPLNLLLAGVGLVSFAYCTKRQAVKNTESAVSSSR